MYAVAEEINLESFGVTHTSRSFFDPQVGALYLPPPIKFSEVPQQELSKVLEQDLAHILSEKELMLNGFNEDELFIERSFDDLTQALRFVRKVCRNLDIENRAYSLDIQEKLRLFDSLVHSQKKLTCRFEVLSGDSCKKFHVDSVNSRMICTYAGPGTQIQKVGDSEVRTLPSGSSLIVKGTNFPDFNSVVLHRSPPIANTGFKRLLFIADV
ncbi:MAG: DUF1826 domain-containing protein [Lentisphaeraceae bacterium]|nr:DUF1826 domain-containing protein [Lentisphaeraceae bacterium]